MAEPAPHLDDGYGSLIALGKAVGDRTRVAILRILARDSFGVLELAEIVDTAQPALSHHLKILLSANLVTKRREGNSLFYRRALCDASGDFAEHVASIFHTVDTLALTPATQKRIARVHRRRSQHSRAFFAANADNFANQQALISATDVYASAVLEQLGSASGAALEVGPGIGSLLPALARRFTTVTAVDDAKQMLERAQATVRAAGLDNVELTEGPFESLPTRTRFNAVVAAMVIHHSPSPAGFFRHAEALLQTNGRLVVVELCRHDQEWVRDACGDLWLGFAEDELDSWAHAVHLVPGPVQYLAQKNGFRIQIRSYTKER